MHLSYNNRSDIWWVWRFTGAARIQVVGQQPESWGQWCFFLLYFISSLFLDGAKWGPWTITAAVSLTTEFKGCNPQISVEKQNLVTVFIYNPNPSNYVILPHCVCVWLPVWSVDKPAAIALARRSRPIHGELWCLQRSWAVQWCSGISQSDENGSQLPPPPQRRHHVVVRHGRYNTMPKEGDKKIKQSKTMNSSKNTTATVREVSASGNNSGLVQLEGSSQQPTGATAWDQLDLLTTLVFF